MGNNKYVKDERITQIKHKITNEAFGIMFFALLAIVFVKCVILDLPTKEYITEFILFIGISFYVMIRMVYEGIYAQNTRKSNKKSKIFIALLSDIIFILVMGVLEYFQGEVNIVFLSSMFIIYFIAFYGIVFISDKITENRIRKLSEED